MLFWDVFLQVRCSNLELVPSCDEGPIWSTFSQPLTTDSPGEHLRNCSVLSDGLENNFVTHFMNVQDFSVHLSKTHWTHCCKAGSPDSRHNFSSVNSGYETSCQNPESRCLLAYCFSLLLMHRHLKLLLQTIMKLFLKLLETIRRIYGRLLRLDFLSDQEGMQIEMGTLFACLQVIVK